ncbi:hypothetical protein ACTFIU_009641 [Dictyostelium citrinum]
MDKLLFCDANEEDLKLIETSDVINEIDDLLPYAGCPCYQFTNINEFKEQLLKDNQLRVDIVKEEELKVKIVESTILPSTSDKDIDFKYVYCRITSYLSNKATIKVTRSNPSLPLTNIELLAIYSKAWQWVYQEEEKELGNPGNIEGMLNRAQSYGRYGIYGHDITDLAYNGGSTIKIYNGFVHCKFSVDS